MQIRPEVTNNFLIRAENLLTTSCLEGTPCRFLRNLDAEEHGSRERCDSASMDGRSRNDYQERIDSGSTYIVEGGIQVALWSLIPGGFFGIAAHFIAGIVFHATGNAVREDVKEKHAQINGRHVSILNAQRRERLREKIKKIDEEVDRLRKKNESLKQAFFLATYVIEWEQENPSSWWLACKKCWNPVLIKNSKEIMATFQRRAAKRQLKLEQLQVARSYFEKIFKN